MEKYVTGSFVDYKGLEHKFVVAGVVEKIKVNKDDFIFKPYLYSPTGTPYEKCLSIGISICNPGDKYDEKIGILQALGRAKTIRREEEDRCLYSTKSGMLSEKVLQFHIENTAKELAENPGLFIRGYNTAMTKWKKDSKQLSESLS